jgi:hypothetical protein
LDRTVSAYDRRLLTGRPDSHKTFQLARRENDFGSGGCYLRPSIATDLFSDRAEAYDLGRPEYAGAALDQLRSPRQGAARCKYRRRGCRHRHRAPCSWHGDTWSSPWSRASRCAVGAVAVTAIIPAIAPRPAALNTPGCRTRRSMPSPSARRCIGSSSIARAGRAAAVAAGRPRESRPGGTAVGRSSC